VERLARSTERSRPPSVAEAIRARAALPDLANLTAYRLFHGDAEGAPGLAVDRFADVAVIHADSEATLARHLRSLRVELADFRTAYAKIHARRTASGARSSARRAAHPPSVGSETSGKGSLVDTERTHSGPVVRPESSTGGTSVDAERLTARSSALNEPPLWGPPVDEVEVQEHGVRYLVRPARGLSVGLFLDMREVRAWLRQQSDQRTVLNLFAYTCSLGVSASLGGAARVVNVDLSKQYLNWGKANYALNDIPTDERDFLYGDALDWLGRFARRQQRFDLVIVDPPSFSSTPFSVRRDYPRLVAAAAQVVAPAGILLAATNHAATSDEHFETWLDDGLYTAGRRGQLVRSWREPRADFPLPARSRPHLKVRALLLD
jgi:23S rRNA (cytosine1962-C5)-methyltransferase